MEAHWRTFDICDRMLNIAGVENYEKKSTGLVCFEPEDEVTDLFGNGYIEIMRKNKKTYLCFCTQYKGSRCIEIGPADIYNNIKEYKTHVDHYFMDPRKKVVFYDDDGLFKIWLNATPSKSWLEVSGMIKY